MVYYLDPDFDPRKLTKSELRSIMASHGIFDLPPPSAKKEELLNLFNSEIIAKRKSILESQKNVKAKSDGIVFLDEASRPSPKKPKKSKSKLVESSSNVETSIPDNGNDNSIPRPETPLAVSTYKLVSRLESLQGTKLSKRKEDIYVAQKSLLIKLLGTIATLVIIILYLYFKFWYVWPTYTNEQFATLENKPFLFLMCPYSKNSLIGTCSDGKLYCASGYIERRNWLGFGSSCVIDKERMSLIQSIKKKIIIELQNRFGLSQCYDILPSAISKADLYNFIFNYFKGMKPSTFSDYFDICLRSLLQEGTKIEAMSK